MVPPPETGGEGLVCPHLPGWGSGAELARTHQAQHGGSLTLDGLKVYEGHAKNLNVGAQVVI